MAEASLISRHMNAREWGTLVLLSVIWGGSFFFIGVAVKELPPLTIVSARVVIAALALLATLAVLRVRLPLRREALVSFLVMGLISNAIPFSLIVVGQTKLASGVASVLNATTPLFAVLVAHVFTADEKLTPARLTGVALGFGGVAVMVGGGALANTGAPLWAYFAALGAAFSYALSGVYGRRFKAMGVPPLATAAGQLSASAVLLTPVALVVDQPWLLPTPSAGAIASVVALALVCSAFAYVLYFRILASAGATNIALVTFLVPVSAILLGVLFLGEVLRAQHFAGMALIALGLAAVDGRAFRLRRRAPA